MRKVLIAALVPAVFAPMSAVADEPEPPPLPPEVAGCLTWYPGAITHGNETDGIDLVCMALTDPMPENAGPGDVYVWCGACAEFPEGPPPAATPVEVGAPPPVTAPMPPPADVRVAPVAPPAVESTTAQRAAPGSAKVKVSHKRVAGATGYVTKCGSRKARSAKLRVTMKARVGTLCQVRAFDAEDRSTWSAPVRVPGR